MEENEKLKTFINELKVNVVKKDETIKQIKSNLGLVMDFTK